MTSLLNNNLVALFPGQGSLSGGAGVGWKNSRHWYQIGVISEASGIDVEDLLTSASDE